MMPLVSIVVANYNNARYLSECLGSVLGQSYTNLEVIVVDDASSDDSVEVIQTLQQGDTRLRLIQNTVNLGVARSRDRGIRGAEGEWISTLDADDFYCSDQKIEVEMDILRTRRYDPSVIPFSGIVLVDNEGKAIGRAMDKENTFSGNLFEAILTRACAIPRDFIFSKQRYIAVGGYDATIPLYEDWDLKIRLAREGTFVFSAIDAIAYRRHGSGLSAAAHEKHLEWIRYVFEKNANTLPNRSVLSQRLSEHYRVSGDAALEEKEALVERLIARVIGMDSETFSVFGIGELTDMFIERFDHLNVPKRINYFIDSRAEVDSSLQYCGHRVLSPKTAVLKGEKVFVLASWRHREMLKKKLLESGCGSDIVIIDAGGDDGKE